MLSMKSRFRLDDLEELKKAVTFFLNDAVNVSMPLSEVFGDIAKRTNGAVSMVFEDAGKLAEMKNEKCAGDVFKKAVDKNLRELYFEADDMDCLYSFAANLDCAYKAQQRDNAQLLLENIRLIQINLNDKALKERRLYNSAGILCGILTCVILF